MVRTEWEQLHSLNSIPYGYPKNQGKPNMGVLVGLGIHSLVEEK
jgi:hypothetical protein